MVLSDVTDGRAARTRTHKHPRTRRFCHQELADWRTHIDGGAQASSASGSAGRDARGTGSRGDDAVHALPPPPKTVLLDITYQGRCASVSAREGDQEGFIRTVRETFEIDETIDVDLRFDRIPDPFAEDDSTLQFAGNEHFSTAMTCIANASQRERRMT